MMFYTLSEMQYLRNFAEVPETSANLVVPVNDVFENVVIISSGTTNHGD
jgi:hypothetical protein